MLVAAELTAFVVTVAAAPFGEKKHTPIATATDRRLVNGLNKLVNRLTYQCPLFVCGALGLLLLIACR